MDCCPEPDGNGNCAMGWTVDRWRCSVELGSPAATPRLVTVCKAPDGRATPGECCATHGDCDSELCVPARPGGPCAGGVCSVPCDPSPDPDGLPGSGDERDRCALGNFPGEYHLGSSCLPFDYAVSAPDGSSRLQQLRSAAEALPAGAGPGSRGGLDGPGRDGDLNRMGGVRFHSGASDPALRAVRPRLLWPGRCHKLQLAAALTLLLAACGCDKPGPAEEPERPRPAPGALRVAILLPGPHNDHEWSQAGYEGLKLIEREFAAVTAYSEDVVEADHEGLFRGFAQEGYDFVIGHGGEFVPAAEKVADEFPRTKFAVVALHPGNNRNLGALRFREEEMGYLTGVVAALRSRTGKVAYVAGMPYRHLQDQAAAFDRGARSIDPSIEVTVEWLDSWTDDARARRIARELLDRGFDVLSVNANGAGLAAFPEAESAGAWTIGWNLDQHSRSPKTVVTSGIQRVPVLLLEGARRVQQGRWEGKQYKLGLREGAQDLAPFYGLLPPEDANRVAVIRDELLSGRLTAVGP